MELIAQINGAVNSFVWGAPMLILLIGVGILMTVRNKGLQFRKFGYAMKNTIGKIFKRTHAGEGEITPFQAVSTALAGTVGTGNIAGITTAVIFVQPSNAPVVPMTFPIAETVFPLICEGITISVSEPIYRLMVTVPSSFSAISKFAASVTDPCGDSPLALLLSGTSVVISLFSVGVDGWSSVSGVFCVLLHELSAIRRAVLTAMTESLEIWRMIKAPPYILKWAN